MDINELEGANWSKIDFYVLHCLEGDSLPILEYSGSHEGWVKLMCEQERFSSTKRAPFLVKVKEGTTLSNEEGLTIYSHIGNIWAGVGTFMGILSLAKNENVIYVEGSRPGFQETVA